MLRSLAVGSLILALLPAAVAPAAAEDGPVQLMPGIDGTTKEVLLKPKDPGDPEATSGGGMVTAVVNGKFELMAIRIEKDVVNPEDVEMLQDLIVAAVNKGVRKAQEMASAEMAKVTGGMKIPGMM